MGSSFLKIVAVACVTFLGREVFAVFFQWFISIHKTVSSALTATCFPDDWFYSDFGYCCISICKTLETILGWMIAESSYKMGFFVLIIQKIVLRFYAFSIWHEDNAGQTCARSICMLHIFCGGSVSTRECFHNNQTQHSSIRI